MSSPYDDLVPDAPAKPDESQPAPKTPVTPVEVPDVKSIFKSKTIWANLIGGAVALLGTLSNSDLVAENPELAAYFTTGMAVLNLFLRLVTKEPVSLTGK